MYKDHRRVEQWQQIGNDYTYPGQYDVPMESFSKKTDWSTQ